MTPEYCMSLIRKTATGLLLGLICSVPAWADISRLEITSQKPYGVFRGGEFALWEGKVHGSLAPAEPIPGLSQAARNSQGRVDYIARIVLIIPVGQNRGNGALLVDIPNRGRAYGLANYNSPRDEAFQAGTFEQGTGFLQDAGFSLLEIYWELGQGADLPSWVDAAGKRQFVEGAGFAIVRDAADYFAHRATDSAGTPNPLKGSINRVIGSGKSQDGRFLKSFLLHGFNQTAGRRVFDGLHVFVAAAGLLPIMTTGPGPQSSGNGVPTFDDPEFRGDTEEPLTIGELVRQVEARGEVPPKIVMINSVSDYYSRRASLGRTGASGSSDQPIPPNVRMYDIAGASHVRVASAPAECQVPPGRLDWTPVSRATLMRLDEWVGINESPPDSMLMPLEPAPDQPPALRAPAYFPQAIVQVPRRDADGNALGGVRLPDLAVPLGTHGGQNKPLTFACMLIGSWSPFAATEAERQAASDKRLSLAERYTSRNDYVGRVRLASHALIAEGFLLPDDAAVIIQAAAAQAALARLRR